MRQWKGRSVRLAHRIVVRDLDYLHSIDDAAADANAKDGRRNDRPTDRSKHKAIIWAQNGKSQKDTAHARSLLHLTTSPTVTQLFMTLRVSVVLCDEKASEFLEVSNRSIERIVS